MNQLCECGGTFRPVVIEALDFTHDAGLPATLRHAPALRCEVCGDETLHGRELERALLALAAQLLAAPVRLDGPSAAFLRRRLDMTQKDLAERMGVTRESVARWERSRIALSAAMDYILRGIALADLGRALGRSDATRCRAAQASVRAAPGRRVRREPLVIDLAAA